MAFAKSLLVLATVWLAGAVHAAAAPVAVSLASEKIILGPGGTATVRLNLQIADSYHIYSTVQSVGARGPGPAATTVAVQPEKLVVIDGALRTSPPVKHYDPDFDLDVLTLEGRAWIDVPLKAAAKLAPGAHAAALVVSYQACNDESCLPPAEVKVSFEIIVPSTDAK